MKFENAAVKILEKLSKEGDNFTKKDSLKKTRIGRNKLEEILNYLSHKGLIHYGNNTVEELRISPASGRDFLLDYKSQEAQHEFNKIVAFTGSILALVGIYTFINDLGLITDTNYWIRYLFLIFTVISLAPIIKFIWDSYFGDLA